MSLIGIWGHSALGKTFWLRSIMDELPELNPELTVVFADNADEYHYVPTQDAWLHTHNNERWQGKREQKLQWPLDLMIVSSRVWVVESMRWFNGLQKDLVQTYLERGCTGLAMIIPYAQPTVHQNFIRQRCALRGKRMSDWWLALENCEYEANYRLSSISKYWQPFNIPAVAFEIDPERRNWATVTNHLKELICKT